MARYTAEHKSATRQRIVERAGHRFKTHGLSRAGVTAVMSDAGLTNGAFYAHFASKDDLVAAVVTEQLDRQRNWIASLTGRKPAESLVREYLSPAHRDDPASGCPSAALLDEIDKSTGQIRDAYTAGIRDVADAILGLLGEPRPEAAHATVLATVAAMAGTLQMARAVTDPDLSDALLERGVAIALAALGIEPMQPVTHTDH
jgi:TetR/AcrR family transcriptional repressor of nem operon